MRLNKSNQLLLDKLLEISKGKFAAPGMNHKQPKKKRKGPKSLNCVTKRKELERIDQENMKLMNRIVNQNAMLNTKKFEEEYRKRKRLQKSLQRNKLQPIQNMLRKKKLKNQRSVGKLPSIAAAGDTPHNRGQESAGGNEIEPKKREKTTDFIHRNKQEVQKKTPLYEKRTPVSSKKAVRATPGKNSKYRPVLKDREQKTKATKDVRKSQTKKKTEDPYKHIPSEKVEKAPSSKSNRSKVSSKKESSHKVNIETIPTPDKASDSKEEKPDSQIEEEKKPHKDESESKPFAFGDDGSEKGDVKQEASLEQPKEAPKEISEKEPVSEKKIAKPETNQKLSEPKHEAPNDKFEEESIDDDYEKFSDEEAPAPKVEDKKVEEPLDESIDDPIPDTTSKPQDKAPVKNVPEAEKPKDDKEDFIEEEYLDDNFDF